MYVTIMRVKDKPLPEMFANARMLPSAGEVITLTFGAFAGTAAAHIIKVALSTIGLASILMATIF